MWQLWHWRVWRSSTPTQRYRNVKSRFRADAVVGNARDTYGYRCALRLAIDANASISPCFDISGLAYSEPVLRRGLEQTAGLSCEGPRLKRASCDRSTSALHRLAWCANRVRRRQLSLIFIHGRRPVVDSAYAGALTFASAFSERPQHAPITRAAVPSSS